MRYGMFFVLLGVMLFQSSSLETRAFPPPAPPFDHPDLKKVVKPKESEVAQPQSQATYTSSGKSRRLFGRFRHR